MADLTTSAAVDALLDDANLAAMQATLGMGTMATQAASAVAITGGTITGTTLNNGAIGGTTPAAGAFTTLTATSLTTTGNLASGSNILATTNTGSYYWGASNDLVLARDAANTLAQRNGTNAQTFRVYNTYTDASNYERGFMRWTSNVLEVGSMAAGTGTQRISKFFYNVATNVFDFAGAGTPESSVTAGVGSTYRRTDGGASTTFYVKESGTGNTGWIAK